MAVCHHPGIDDPLIPRIATAFAGIGRTGEVCGAVVGAVMGLSVKHGRDDPRESDAELYAFTRRFLQVFRDEMGSIYCRELTGHDLSTPEGIKAFRHSDVPIRVCLRGVGFAYDETLKLLGA